MQHSLFLVGGGGCWTPSQICFRIFYQIQNEQIQTNADASRCLDTKPSTGGVCAGTLDLEEGRSVSITLTHAPVLPSSPAVRSWLLHPLLLRRSTLEWSWTWRSRCLTPAPSLSHTHTLSPSLPLFFFVACLPLFSCEFYSVYILLCFASWKTSQTPTKTKRNQKNNYSVD